MARQRWRERVWGSSLVGMLVGSILAGAAGAAWTEEELDALLEDPAAVAALSYEDLAGACSALVSLERDEEAGTMCATWVTASEAYKSVPVGELPRLAELLRLAGEAGRVQRQSLAEHVTATYLANVEATRSVGLEAWSGLASRLAADLSEEQRSTWAAALRAAFVEDADVLNALGPSEVRHLAGALTSLGEASRAARQHLGEYVTATYLTDAETVRAVGLEIWSSLASSLVQDLPAAERTRWAAGLRSAFVEDLDVLAALGRVDVEHL